MRLKLRYNFFLGPKKNEAKILFQSTYSNLFLSLLDMKNKIICFKSSGHISDFDNKKKKKFVSNIDILMESISKFLILYKIKTVIIILRTKRMRFFGNPLIKKIRSYGIFIKILKYYVPIAHNGVKGRHVRYKKSHRRRRKKRKKKRRKKRRK